jgi:hypothetical protein
MLKRGTRTCTRLYRGSTQKRLLVRGSRAVFRDPDYTLPPLAVEMVTDTDAQWMEVSFISPSTLTGNATDGWTWSNGQHALALSLETSGNLIIWETGDVEDAAGSPATVTGGYEYKARALVPRIWNTVMIDIDVASTRGGKDITGLDVFGSAVTLPNFPYAMPADAATLEADLVAEGYTGATVTTTAAPWTVSIRNHTAANTQIMPVTHSGETVTAVAPLGGSTISLPGYPYALPGDAADLQTDLRTAGYTGAVVMLHNDEWAIHLPDLLPASGGSRAVTVTIDPGDPFPVWDAFGVYQGLAAATNVNGEFSNVRTPSGDPLLERARQFARLRVTRTAP